MKTIWVIIGVIILIAIIYWIYKKSKTVETVIVNERKREPIPNIYAIRTVPNVVYNTNGGGKNIGSESVLNVAIR